jgi:hypothetical protein
MSAMIGAACSQNQPRRRSKAAEAWNVAMCPVVLAAELSEHRALNEMSDKKGRPPPVTEQRRPERELEEELQRNPECPDAKVDVGSDESMDASDPPAATQPRSNEPAPSSGFEDEDES